MTSLSQQKKMDEIWLKPLNEFGQLSGRNFLNPHKILCGIVDHATLHFRRLLTGPSGERLYPDAGRV